MSKHIYKSAVDGKIVSKAQAERNPETTYRCTIKAKPKSAKSKKGK